MVSNIEIELVYIVAAVVAAAVVAVVAEVDMKLMMRFVAVNC